MKTLTLSYLQLVAIMAIANSVDQTPMEDRKTLKRVKNCAIAFAALALANSQAVKRLFPPDHAPVAQRQSRVP